MVAATPLLTNHSLTASYLHVAVCTVWIWDALTSVSSEIEARRRIGFRITLPDTVYLLARVIAGVTVLTNIIHAVVWSKECDTGLGTQTVAWIAAFASPLNTLLFLIRANAVFMQSKRSRVAFFLLWITTFATLTAPFSLINGRLQPMGYCFVERVKRIGAAGAITIAIFDTVVFTSITYKLLAVNRVEEPGSGALLFVNTTNRMSKVLLMTGQLYYFPVITLNTLVMAVTLSSSAPPQYQAVALVADVVFQNAMACHVFRLLRLGFLQNDSTSLDILSCKSPLQWNESNIDYV
ncbi:hypothetical protein QCA50_006535 [Cerrena zonata]|uniref:Uncharacterized protein n=1 Tax=Cerrena zonata TaxID=2478898 RepID=A0AAW0GK40_9APHY